MSTSVEETSVQRGGPTHAHLHLWQGLLVSLIGASCIVVVALIGLVQLRDLTNQRCTCHAQPSLGCVIVAVFVRCVYIYIIILYDTILYYITLYYIYYIVSYHSILYCIILYYIILYHIYIIMYISYIMYII